MLLMTVELQAEQLGFNSWQGQEFFSSPPHPCQLWGQFSLLSSGYQVFFPWR